MLLCVISMTIEVMHKYWGNILTFGSDPHSHFFQLHKYLLIWWLRSSGIWHCVALWVVSNLWKEWGVFIINGQAVKKNEVFFWDCLTLENEDTVFLQNIKNHSLNNIMSCHKKWWTQSGASVRTSYLSYFKFLTIFQVKSGVLLLVLHITNTVLSFGANTTNIYGFVKISYLPQ